MVGTWSQKILFPLKPYEYNKCPKQTKQLKKLNERVSINQTAIFVDLSNQAK